MDLFTEKKYARWIILLLILMNLVTLGVIWYLHRPPDEWRPPRPDRDGLALLVRELDLDGRQVEEVRRLRQRHFEDMRGYQQAHRKIRRQLIEHMFERDIDSISFNRMSDSLARVFSRMEMERLRHFQDLRHVLREDQKHRFRRLMHRMIRADDARMGEPKGPRLRKPRN